MKKFCILWILAMGLYCGGVHKEEILTSESSVQPVVVTFFSGEVSIHRNGNERKPVQGMELSPEDEIRTGENGRVEVLVRNAGLIRLAASTSVSVSSFLRDGVARDTNLHLNYGTVVSVVKKERKTDNFNVITPTLVAGVRGTIFSTRVENSQSKKAGCSPGDCVVRVEVLEGKVAVRKKESPKEVVLEKNTSLLSKGNEEIRQDSVLPIAKKSLDELKEMLVFQRDHLGGFENLIDEVKRASEELAGFDRGGDLDSVRKSVTSKVQTRTNDEVRKIAEEIDTRKYLEKDLAKEKLKLEPKETF